MDFISNTLLNLVSLAVTLGILVTIHEYGHYWVARKCDVKVERFSIGFGKAICSWKRGETEFQIAAIPLGGYVQMLGENKNDEISELDKGRALNHKSLLQRSLIVSAGPIANLLLAFILYWFMFVIGVSGVAPVIGNITEGSPAAIAGLLEGDEIISVDNDETRTWQEVFQKLADRLGETGNIEIKTSNGASNTIVIERWLSNESEPDIFNALGIEPYRLDLTDFLNSSPALLGEIVEGGSAYNSGLETNDLIVTANGQSIEGWGHWVDVIRANPEIDILVGIEREGVAQIVSIKPALTSNEEGESYGYIGAALKQPDEMPTLPESMIRETRFSVIAAIPKAFNETVSKITFVFVAIKKMIVGLISVKNLSGPITIAQVAGQTVSYGLEYYLSFLAVLSISLGVFNLLPVPMLDGGHLFYNLIEAIIRKPVPEKIQALGMQVGVTILACLMFFVFYNDISRLF